MRRLRTFIFICFILLCIYCPTDTNALMRIIGDPLVNGLSASFAENDDGNEETPPSPENNHFITVNNHYRRYVGVCMDQVQNGTTVPIDNGKDDRYIPPATELFSISAVAGYFKDMIYGEYPPTRRTYAFPKPHLLPGEEIKYPIRVVGPAWGKQLPFPLDDQNHRCYGEDALGSAVATSAHLLLLPLLGQATGTAIDDNFWQTVVSDLLINFPLLEIEIANDLADGDIVGIIENIVKYIIDSKVLKGALKNHPKWSEGLEAITDMLPPVALAEALTVFTHLYKADWYNEFEVRIVRPKIDSLQPNMGPPGSTIAVSGVGFDPEFGTESKNNRVFFRNASGGEVEATEVKTLDENLLEVTVPEGAATGFVKVCTSSPPSMGAVSTLCSNEDVIFTVGLAPSLSIISPIDGTTVSGTVDISVELKNPPNPFPPSEAELWVDNQPSGRMAISSSTFIFAFDTSVLTKGEHIVEVWLNVAGEIYTSLPLLLFVEAEEPSGPRLIISSPSPDQHFYKNQAISVTAEILNGPAPTSPSETLDYTVSVNGNAWTYKSIKPYTAYPGCYKVTFSLEDLELQGEKVISVRAVGKNVTTPLYDLTASVKIWVDDAFMEYPRNLEVSGCIDQKNPLVILLPWPDHSKVIDQAFSIGTCGPDSSGKYGNYIVNVEFQNKMTSSTFGTYYITRNAFSNIALSNKPFRFYTAGTASNPTLYIESSIYDLPGDSCRWPTNQLECKIYNYTREWCDGIECWPSVRIIDNPCTADPYYPDTTERFKLTIYTFGKHPCAYYVSER